MDVHDLSAILHMQNQTQHLLQQLQHKQLKCRELLDTSISSTSSLQNKQNNTIPSKVASSRKSKSQKEPGQFVVHPVFSGDSTLHSTDSQNHDYNVKLKEQRVKDAYAARTKLSQYRKVDSADNRPGLQPEAKLAQGLENGRFLFGDTNPSTLSNGDINHLSAKFITSTHQTSKNLYNGVADDASEESENHLMNGFGDTSDFDQGKANTSVTFLEELELLGSPKQKIPRTPEKSTKSQAETPKSILKRRKIIDDNVKVQSKYNHTPINRLTPNNRGLNYSYSDDLDAGSSQPSSQRGGKHRYSEATDGSYIDEYLDDETEVPSKGSDKHTKEKSKDKDLEDRMKELDNMMKERLLLDSGNDRKNASLVLDLSQRPKSHTFERVGDLHEKKKSNSRENTPSKSPKTTVNKPKSPKSTRTRASKTEPHVRDSSGTSKIWKSRDKPLLGYDWIAGNLDNENSLFSLPDDYFYGIQDFRKSNKDECSGNELLRNKFDLTRAISPEIQDPAHKCIHGYTVNDRLFTEPMNPDEDGRSACPVCLIPREDPSKDSPGFIRVSIPRSTLEKPYRVKPHRRRSFDSTDTYALSQHCVAGYECTLPTTIPTAKNIDMKGANGIQGKQAMSLGDAENFVKNHSRASRLMSKSTVSDSLAPGPNSTQDSTTSRKNTSALSISRNRDSSVSSGKPRTTEELLNLSHGLRYNLQDLARRKGKDRHRAPHSTEYPIF